MLLGMQDFNFCPETLSNFAQICPNFIQICPNLSNFFQIKPKFNPNWLKFCPNLPKKIC